MRTIPPEMWRLWSKGGPFIGDLGKPHGRVTVEKDWFLNLASDVSTPTPTKLPFRWYQRIDNSQVETELPNLKTIDIDRSLDSDAASCSISLYNTTMERNHVGQNKRLGDPGFLTWRTPSLAAKSRWDQIKGPWANVLVPNALLRTYQGFGGVGKSIEDALRDGNIILTGVWLIDEVRPGTDGMLQIKCRDMAKLLIEQQLYLPLIPSAWYPLHYSRWDDDYIINEGAPVYDYTDPIENSPVPAEGPKYATDLAISPDNHGYWILGSDGGVFAEGTPYYGSRGGTDGIDNAPMVSMAADPLNHGYWLASANGGVFAFGDVPFYGSMSGQTLAGPIVDMAAHPSGRGYWLVGSDGGVYAFGRAGFHGSRPNTQGRPIVSIESSKSGDGYYLVDNRGGVYCYGDAPFFGSAIDFGIPVNPSIWDRITGMSVRPQGDGYWLVSGRGNVYAFGAAPYLNVSRANLSKGTWADVQITLQDPIFDISGTPTGDGYLMVAGDGGVFAFGDAPFYGSLPADFMYHVRKDGNYKDYADIIKDLLLWSGWLAYGTGKDDVYGNIETTGAYAEAALAQDNFDKKGVIDGINFIKEIVGYHFWVDEEGAARFESPNWFQVGNFLEDGTHVQMIPEIDEKIQLTEYSVNFADKDMRSEIIISSYSPEANNSTTVTTRKKVETPGVDIVRGMVRPAMWIDQRFTVQAESEHMAELLVLQILRGLRMGQLTCVANPAIQVNDQVQIQERNTGETYIHYVRGAATSMDLDAGSYTMTLTTNWLVNDGVVT